MAVARSCLRRVTSVLFQCNNRQMPNITIENSTTGHFKHGQCLLSRPLHHYRDIRFLDEHPDDIEYEVVKDPPEWKHVENLLPLRTVPKFEPKPFYPSGWQPQSPDAVSRPYYIARSKNRMLSCYLRIVNRGQRRHTLVKRIYGDIWQFNDEIKHFLETKYGRIIATSVNELNGSVQLKGDYVIDISRWMYAQGF